MATFGISTFRSISIGSLTSGWKLNGPTTLVPADIGSADAKVAYQPTSNADIATATRPVIRVRRFMLLTVYYTQEKDEHFDCYTGTMLKRSTVRDIMAISLLAGVVAVTWWFLVTAREITSSYDAVSRQLAAQPTLVSTVTLDNQLIHIPTWTLFHDGNIWSLVSADRQLGSSYTPELVATPVPHTAGDVQIAKTIAPPLTALFAAAKANGVPLMVSSAYRSPEDQQEIYDFYLRAYGQSYVNSYVAFPGKSEHQTGLAVDISSFSNDCSLNAGNCSLDYDAILWLRQNSSRFGFVQRYPSGKQSITGVAGEAWHYRYVGVTLAKFMESTNLTLDEFVQQAAPGYAK